MIKSQFATLFAAVASGAVVQTDTYETATLVDPLGTTTVGGLAVKDIKTQVTVELTDSYQIKNTTTITVNLRDGQSIDADETLEFFQCYGDFDKNQQQCVVVTVDAQSIIPNYYLTQYRGTPQTAAEDVVATVKTFADHSHLRIGFCKGGTFDISTGVLATHNWSDDECDKEHKHYKAIAAGTSYSGTTIVVQVSHTDLEAREFQNYEQPAIVMAGMKTKYEKGETGVAWQSTQSGVKKRQRLVKSDDPANFIESVLTPVVVPAATPDPAPAPDAGVTTLAATFTTLALTATALF